MGCTDSKVTNLNMSKKFNFLFLVGPIHDVENGIPYFNFTSEAEIHPEKVIPTGTYIVLPSVWSNVTGCGSTTCPMYDPVYADNTVAVVCSIVIPCVVIAIALGIWAFCFYKRGGYKKFVNDSGKIEDESKNLIEEDYVTTK